MLRRLRQLALDRAFGKGAGGFLAASAIGWLIDQVRSADEPERLDTARLVPGETYLVTTRPPMTRSERRDAKRLAAATAKLEKERTPSRRTRRTAAGLAKAQRRAGAAAEGSRRKVRNERKVEVLGAEFDRLTTPSREQRKLEASVVALSSRMERHRADALAASGKRRSPRTRTFT